LRACIALRITGRVTPVAPIVLAALLLTYSGCSPGVSPAVAPGAVPSARPTSTRPSGTSGMSNASGASSPSPTKSAGDARPALPCAADVGPAPSCARLSDATCLGATLARRACETAGPLLLPSVAERWVTCLSTPADGSSATGPSAANRDAACDSSRILPCGFVAAESVCIDGSFHELCGRLSEDCTDVAPEITVRRCEQLLSAFRPNERPKMIDCLRQGCGSGSFGACLP
jgi:hypothetical protein